MLKKIASVIVASAFVVGASATSADAALGRPGFGGKPVHCGYHACR